MPKARLFQVAAWVMWRLGSRMMLGHTGVPEAMFGHGGYAVS